MPYDAEDDERPKRVLKMSAKGLEYSVTAHQENRSAKFKQAKRCMEKMNVLMESKENGESVKNELSVFINCCEEAHDIHKSLMNLPLPEDEVERQNKYFMDKMTQHSDFTKKVKGWLSDTSHSCVEPNKDNFDECAANEVNPEDSVSNVSSVKGKANSQLSRTSSSTSSARIKAEADMAALEERLAAQRRKHQIEAQQESLRREKEQLELETELAATKAKLQVLENSSQCSKHSNGMNSYFERKKQQKVTELSADARTFVPDTMDRQNYAPGLPAPVFQPPVVKPKQRQFNHMNEMALTVDGPGHVMQAASRIQKGHAHQTQTLADNHHKDIVNVMQRQNDIAALLVQQNLSSALPSRIISVFDGDPLQYRSFISAFENGVEAKAGNWSDCLYFLEQYTRGQPRDLVHSCQHLPPELGYHRAKSLLAEHFGNEHKIAAAYMDKILNWTPVQNEDVKGLQSFSLFLRGCANLTEQLRYMKELDLPSNLRSIIQKLPYKLRDKWRNVACDLQERRGERATFTDLVGFIERQVKIASDPVFGCI